ncbi:MAG TPA: PadR family transcriptional regulator [Alphaproteobacteria bacterium]|nr:PadR family transcriptional regulator [Alphaproteobacteria bacterium]
MLRNHLKIIVMDKLRDRPLSGYDLIKEIYTSTSWKPSFGSMYPLLKELHTKKLVNVKTVNRKKVYSLSAQGIKVLDEAIEAKKNISDIMRKQFEIMNEICTPKEHHHMKNVIKEFKDGPVMFANFSKEFDEVHQLMFKLYKQGKTNTKEAEIKKILNDMIIKLRKVK